MSWMRITSIVLVAIVPGMLCLNCDDDSCGDHILMPLLNDMKATLKADLDVTNMNKHLQSYIQQEIKKGVEKAMKNMTQKMIDDGVKEVNATISSILQQNDEDEQERPAFHASLKVNPFTLVGIDDILKFDDVIINRGNGYSPSSGIFRAPKTGLYQISCLVLAGDPNYVSYQLNKNNELYINGFVEQSVSTGSQTLISLMELKKGDRVFIKHRSDRRQIVYGYHHSTFSGYFIRS